MLTILQKKCSKSYVALQEKFFLRKRFEGESFQEYSHAIFCLMERVNKSIPAGMVIQLSFVEHVLDPSSQRELQNELFAKI